MTYTNAIPCPEFVIDRCNPGRLKHSICNIGSHLMKIFAPHKDTMSQKGKRHYTLCLSRIPNESLWNRLISELE